VSGTALWTLTGSFESVKGKNITSLEKISMPSEKQKRFNITLSEADASLIEELKSKLNKELMMDLSSAQVIRRLLKQATTSVNS
jgi:hypothetical protein